jgi:hypothetical protein
LEAPSNPSNRDPNGDSMRTLAFALLASSSLVGCTTSSTEEGHIAATWTLKTVVGNQTVTCPPGVTKAALHTVESSPDGVEVSPCTTPADNCFIDVFDCAAGSGVSAPLPATNYLTWLVFGNDDFSQVYATSISGFVDITTTDKTFHADILTDGGYFLLRWNLVGQQSGQTLACADTDAGAAAGGKVSTLATLIGPGMQGFTDEFACESHFNYTAGVPAGTYTVEVDAINSNKESIGNQMLMNKVVGSHNQITDLGTINIPIQGK